MTKALKVVQDFAYRRSCLTRAYTDRINSLQLPRGFTPDHLIRIEKENRAILLIALTSEKFHIIKLSSLEIVDGFYIELREELLKAGIKEV